jgi:hypothetical protein
VFDDDGIPVLSSTAGGSGTSVDPNSTLGTRDIKIRFDDQPIDGYVRLNGRTIGSVASGATERANLDTQSLFEELWTYPNIVVSGGKGASGPADYTANKQLQLPNCAGRGLFGMDDMGAGAQGNLTAATIANPTLVGSVGGSQQVTLAQNNLPNYTLTGGASGVFTVSGTTSPVSNDHSHTYSGSGTTGNDSPDHTHGFTAILANPSVVGMGTGGVALQANNAASTTGGANQRHAHGFSWSGTTSGISANHTHTYSANGQATGININSGGSGVAASNLPPVMTFMVYIRL